MVRNECGKNAKMYWIGNHCGQKISSKETKLNFINNRSWTSNLNTLSVAWHIYIDIKNKIYMEVWDHKKLGWCISCINWLFWSQSCNHQKSLLRWPETNYKTSDVTIRMNIFQTTIYFKLNVHSDPVLISVLEPKKLLKITFPKFSEQH